MSDESNSFWNSEEWREYEKFMENKKKTIITGDNVIHLNHIGDSVPQSLILKLKDRLKEVDLEFSTYDTSGTVTASVTGFSFDCFLSVTPAVFEMILDGVGTNALWDVIKLTTRSIWKSVKGRTYYSGNAETLQAKEITFGIKVKLDDKTSFGFQIEGNLTDELFEKSFDKILPLLEAQSRNVHFKFPYIMVYDKKNNKWNKIDVEEAIAEKIKKSKDKRK